MSRGFDARVEPFSNISKERMAEAGFWGKITERWKWGRIASAVAKRIPQCAPILRQAQSPCVCNLKIARIGVLNDLKEFARSDDRFRHLVEGRESMAVYLPIAFQEPLVAGALHVGSSVRLQQELAELNKSLQVEKTFALKKMVDFLSADEEAISKYESKFDTTGGFWLKFGYVIIKKLTDMSLQHKLPIVFH